MTRPVRLPAAAPRMAARCCCRLGFGKDPFMNAKVG